jgi:hypothetical protein
MLALGTICWHGTNFVSCCLHNSRRSNTIRIHTSIAEYVPIVKHHAKMTASCDSAFSSDQSQSGLFYLQVHNNDHEDELLGRSRTNVVQKAVPSLVHVLLLLIGGVIGSILTIKLTPKSQSVSSPPYWAHLGSMRGMSSPAFDVVRSHPLVHQAHQHDGTANPYRGAPGEVSNSAWKILLHGYNLRVPTDELPSDQSPSIHLTDGSDDAWVSLGVYHHLHCLDSLRHQLGGQQCPSYDTNYDENGFSKHFGMLESLTAQRND